MKGDSVHVDPDSTPDSSEDRRRWTLRDVLSPIFRHTRAGLMVAAALFAATLLYVLFSPRTYDAEMTLIVKRERADTIVGPGPGSSASDRGDVSEDELNSEVELLRSRDLLEQVAVSAGLVDSKGAPGTRPASENAARELAWAVQTLEANLNVSPLRKTTLIRVSYSSTDPVLAAKVLSELGRVYLEKHLALHRPQGAYQFFSAQTDRFRTELDAAESQLKEYGEREMVVSADLEKDSALRQLAEFEALLEQARVQAGEATRRMRELQHTAASTPARQTTQITTSDSSQLLAQLRARVLDLEVKHADMLRRFTPTYPPVVELEGQLAQAKAALEQTERTPLTQETTDENPTHQWLENELARVRSERAAALARADGIAASVRLYQDKARDLEEKSTVQQELKRAIKSAEDNYQLYLRKQEEARISDALDRTRIANVAIAQAPTVPALPSSGGRKLLLLVGLVMACMAGLATTFVVDYLSPYFETPDDVEGILNIPVLLTLPAKR